MKRTIKYLPFAVIAVLSLVWNLLTEWHLDGVEYQFMFPEDFSSFDPDKHIETFRDVVVSQRNHYFIQHGRYITHFLIQLYTGLWGKAIFAISNALVWMLLPWLSLKVTHVRITLSNACISCSLMILLFFYLHANPSFQINYVWMSALLAIFLLIFFDGRAPRYGLWSYVGIALLSVVFGNGNESFSFAVGSGLLAYAIVRRFKLMPRQWVAGLFLLLGTVIILASPGTWARVEHNNSMPLSLGPVFETSVVALIIPVIALIVYLSGRKNKRSNTIGSIPEYVIWTSVIAAYVLGVALKMTSGARMLIVGNYFLALWIIVRLQPLMHGRKARISISLTFSVVGLTTMILAMSADYRRSEADRMVYSLYGASTDGRVYVPDDMMGPLSHRFIYRKESYVLNSRYLHPGKPALQVLPESARGIDEKLDTNYAVKIADQCWLMVRSQTAPVEFKVSKTILPGMINRPMAPRLIEWDLNDETVIDSTACHLTGIYYNSRPYIEAELTMQ